LQSHIPVFLLGINPGFDGMKTGTGESIGGDFIIQKVKAVFKNGVLTVELPRVEAEKPKKIAVKAS